MTDHVKTEMSAYEEETFGPVRVVVRVDDQDTASASTTPTPASHAAGASCNFPSHADDLTVRQVGIAEGLPDELSGGEAAVPGRADDATEGLGD